MIASRLRLILVCPVFDALLAMNLIPLSSSASACSFSLVESLHPVFDHNTLIPSYYSIAWHEFMHLRQQFSCHFCKSSNVSFTPSNLYIFCLFQHLFPVHFLPPINFIYLIYIACLSILELKQKVYKKLYKSILSPIYFHLTKIAFPYTIRVSF